MSLLAVVLAATWLMLEQVQDRLQAQETRNAEAFGKINQTLGECQSAVSVIALPAFLASDPVID